MFGNTEQVARAVAGGLGDGGVDAVVVDVAAAPVDLSADLRPPRPRGAHPRVLPEPAEHPGRRRTPGCRRPSGQPGGCASGSPPCFCQDPRHSPVTAVFDTRVSKVRRLPAAAGPRAARLARRRGLTVLGRPQAFVVADVCGPLVDGELERAAAWGHSLADALERRVSSRARST